MLDKTESRSKDDRGVVHVETRGYKQDGTVVCTFRRKVMVPKRSYGDARGGEQPGRPVPQGLARALSGGGRPTPGGCRTAAATSGRLASVAASHQRASVASSPARSVPPTTAHR